MTRGKQDSDAMVLEGARGVSLPVNNLVCVELYGGDKATTVTHGVPREKKWMSLHHSLYLTCHNQLLMAISTSSTPPLRITSRGGWHHVDERCHHIRMWMRGATTSDTSLSPQKSRCPSHILRLIGDVTCMLNIPQKIMK